MKYSNIAFKVFLLTQLNNLTNTKFWTKYESPIIVESELPDSVDVLKERYKEFLSPIENTYADGFICCFDEEFPVINPNVKNRKEKPYLLFYKGDISLLKNINSNVAVIGALDPDEDIIIREQKVVEQLVNNNVVIVSGLAKGCDSCAHSTCLENDGKTIAILPSPVDSISPKANSALADAIVKKGGLLITEYYTKPKNRFEVMNRLIDRDRLQAMFSKCVIMIASYRQSPGADSGSRHAMESAAKYRIPRYVLFNPETDTNNLQFGLNKDYLNDASYTTKIVTHGTIKRIAESHLD